MTPGAAADSFLQGGGEMGDLTRSYSWADSPIGAPGTWPAGLRINVANVLRSAFPMLLLWGPDLLVFYNDAFQPTLLASGKHPALGKPARSVWPESWHLVGPLLESVLQSGAPVWRENQLVPSYRNGGIQDIYWTFCYSAAAADDGSTGGVLVTCMETTGTVQHFSRLKESEELLRFTLEAAELGTWDYDPATNLFSGNDRLKEWFGLPPAGDLNLDLAINVMAEADRARVSAAIATALRPESGGRYDIEYDITPPPPHPERVVRAKGRAWFGPDGSCYRFNGTLQDVTDQVRARRKIEESAREVQALIESAPFPIGVYTGPGLSIAFANEAILAAWGKSPDVIGKRYIDVLPELEGSELYRQLQAVYASGVPFHAQNQRVNLLVDGRMQAYYFNYSFTPLFDAAGAVYGVMNTGSDVTDLNVAKQQAEQSEQRFQNLIRGATVGMIVLLGEDMTVSVVNAAYGRLINRSADELLHKRLFDIIPEAEETFRPLLDTVRRTGEPLFLYDAPYLVYSNGEPIEGYLNVVYQPYREVDGAISGVMALCQDITEQVRARKKIEEVEERAKLAIAAAELGSFDVDLHTNHILTSERMDAIFEVAHTDERQRYIAAIHPDDLPVRNAAYAAAFESGVLAYEARIIRKNGLIRWFRARGRVFFDAARKPFKLAGVVQDITEEKRFAEELTRQVRERTQELEEFTYVSHHDLQEPLRKIMMFTDMVQGDAETRLSEAAQLRLGKVASAARRMSTALKDVLNFSSLNKKESVADVDLNAVCADVQNDLELAIEEKGARIHAGSLPVIEAVPQQMHQLLYNLINNALKFARAGVPPEIQITCTRLPKEDVRRQPDLLPGTTYYEISVADNGIGFDPAAAEKIFVLFQRLHSKDSYSGTGIGLALCRKVVQNHGGKIWAEGKQGAGARFHVLLPATQEGMPA